MKDPKPIGMDGRGGEGGGLEIDADNKLSRASLDMIRKQMGASIGDPQHVANAVLYVAAQPVEIEIEELVIRPPKALQID